MPNGSTKAHEHTELYRHYADDGKLLYVGISLSAVGRLEQHKRAAGWFGRIARVEIERFDCRSKARDAERQAIRDEAPAWNIRDRASADRVTRAFVAQRAEESRRDLVARLVSFKPIYTVAEFADVTNEAPAHIRRLIESGELAAIVWSERKTNAGKISMQYRLTGWEAIDYLERMAARQTRHAT